MDKKTSIYHFWGKKPTKQNTTQQKPKLPSESCLIFLVISFPCPSCKDRRGFWVGDWRPWLDSLLSPLLANPIIEQMWNLSRLLSCSCSQLLPGEEQVSPGSPLPQKGSWVCLFTGQMYIDFFFFFNCSFFSHWFPYEQFFSPASRTFPFQSAEAVGVEKEWSWILLINHIWSSLEAGFSISWCDHLPLVFNGLCFGCRCLAVKPFRKVVESHCSCAACDENSNSLFFLLNGSDFQCICLLSYKF